MYLPEGNQSQVVDLTNSNLVTVSKGLKHSPAVLAQARGLCPDRALGNQSLDFQIPWTLLTSGGHADVPSAISRDWISAYDNSDFSKQLH